MPDKDDLILTALMDIKSDVGEIKATTENQDKCIDQLQKDVSGLKKGHDQVTGGMKVVVAVSAVISAAMGWIAAHLPTLR